MEHDSLALLLVEMVIGRVAVPLFSFLPHPSVNNKPYFLIAWLFYQAI